MKCAIFEEHSSSCVVYSRFSGALFPVSMIDGGISKVNKICQKYVSHYKASYTISKFQVWSGRNSDYLFSMYDYCELYTTWHPGLVVSLSDWSKRTKCDSQVGIYFSAHFFKRFNAELLHTILRKTIEGYQNYSDYIAFEKIISKQSIIVSDRTANMQFTKMQNKIYCSFVTIQ